MSLRRAGTGTLRLLRAYATNSLQPSSQQQQTLVLRTLPQAALQLTRQHCPLTPHAARGNAWQWYSELQPTASVPDFWRQLATTPDSSSSSGSGSGSGGKDKEKEKEKKVELPDAEVCVCAARCDSEQPLHARA